MNIKVDCAPNHQVLLVELLNISGGDVDIPADNLPWDSTSSAIVFHAEQNGIALIKIRPLGHNDNLVTIKKGLAISEKIDLIEVFPDLPVALRSGGLVISWDYYPASVQLNSLGDYKGDVVLKKECWK